MSDRTSTATVDRDTDLAAIAAATSEAGLALADLARLDRPRICAWRIAYNEDLRNVLIEGQLATIADIDRALDAWAEVLETAQRQTKSYTSVRGKGEVSVIGVYGGAMVKIWDGVDMPGGAA